MARNNLDIKAYNERVYAKGFGEFVRTFPMKGDEAPFIGYIKTTIGEARVPYNSTVLYEVLSSGEEISEAEYNEAKLTVVNEL